MVMWRCGDVDVDLGWWWRKRCGCVWVCACLCDFLCADCVCLPVKCANPMCISVLVAVCIRVLWTGRGSFDWNDERLLLAFPQRLSSIIDAIRSNDTGAVSSLGSGGVDSVHFLELCVEVRDVGPDADPASLIDGNPLQVRLACCRFTSD